MTTAMNSLQNMVDVNTIIGEPIETTNNIIIIPISKVGFGFAAGGSEFKGETVDEYTKKEKEEAIQYRLPFGGGSGAGVSITPVAFLVVQQNNVKLLPVSHCSSIDRLLDYVPDLMEKINNQLNKIMQNIQQDKKEQNKRRETIQKEIKETLEDMSENPTVSKIKPRRSRISKQEPATTTYEYEYNEIDDTEDEGEDE
jgi:sporulation protein YtfJ